MRYTLLLAISLSACTPTLAPLTEPQLRHTRAEAPPNAAPGACYGREVIAAVTKSVERHVIVQRAELNLDGTIRTPEILRKAPVDEVVVPRRELWFEIPCGLETDVALVETIQRALQVRGHYSGAINGKYDARTRKAVRSYQSGEGLDSGILSLAAAQKLGIIALGRPKP